MEQNKKKTIILTIAAILFLMILVMGATYAYFQIITNNNTNTSNISGVIELVGQATLTTNVSKLKLNLTADMMHESKVGTKYYATLD